MVVLLPEMVIPAVVSTDARITEETIETKTTITEVTIIIKRDFKVIYFITLFVKANLNVGFYFFSSSKV